MRLIFLPESSVSNRINHVVAVPLPIFISFHFICGTRNKNQFHCGMKNGYECFSQTRMLPGAGENLTFRLHLQQMNFKTTEESEIGANAFGKYENSDGVLHSAAFIVT
jgi:hypothetical protein